MIEDVDVKTRVVRARQVCVTGTQTGSAKPDALVPEPITKSLGDQLAVTFAANKAANLNLSFNGTPVASAVAADSVKTTLTITVPGNQQLIATASDGTTIIAAAFMVAGLARPQRT